MECKTKKVLFQLDHVVVTVAGPLKDESAFEGNLMIVEEVHGPTIEWYPLKFKSNDCPEMESSDWDDITTAVGFKANHDESLDAVEIKAVRTPNAIKFEISDLTSYKKMESSDGQTTVVTFLLKDGTHISPFQFSSNEFGRFCAALDNYVNFKRSKKENNLYLTVNPKDEALEKSFSELDLFPDSKPHIITKLIQDPYTTAMGGFSKVANYLFDAMLVNNGNESHSRHSPVDFSEMIVGNILNVDIDHQEEPGYELITRINLPPRETVTRDEPLTQEEFNNYLDSEERITNPEGLKRHIFRGGASHSIRAEVWKYLLGFYDFNNTKKEKATIRTQKSEDYFRMKLQWKSFTADQESRFSALRDRKSLIEKDVSRTDRTHPFFEGEHNPNVEMLQDILLTYCMYNFDLGYVQGMSDLLSPILVVMQDEVDAFWCFAGWLKDVGVNFELEQLGMKKQLQDLHRLLHFEDSLLCQYLENHESGNMYFAFRWLLILFKRDFKFLEIMRLWEVLWSGLPCKNFHLLICIAILDSEKSVIMENDYGLTEILKHVNEMSYKINLDETLAKAEAIFIQIKNSKHRSDVVDTILGLDPVVVEVRSSGPSRFANGAIPGLPHRLQDSSENSDDYVDLEQNCNLPFDIL